MAKAKIVIPIYITLIRIFIQIALLIALMSGVYTVQVLALALFLVSLLLDKLDGTWARRLEQVTDFGKYLDSTVDRIVVLTTIAAFIAIFPRFPKWAYIAILSRDLSIMGLRHYMTHKKIRLSKRSMAKIKKTGDVKRGLEVMALIVCFFLLHPFSSKYTQELWIIIHSSLGFAVIFGFYGLFLGLCCSWGRIIKEMKP